MGKDKKRHCIQKIRPKKKKKEREDKRTKIIIKNNTAWKYKTTGDKKNCAEKVGMVREEGYSCDNTEELKAANLMLKIKFRA